MRKRLLTLLLAVCLCVSVLPMGAFVATAAGTPVELTVGNGKLRVEVYADDIVRVRYAPDGTFRDKGLATFVDKSVKWEAADYETAETDEEFTLTTAKLTVCVNKADGKVSYYDKEGNLVAAESGRASQKVALDGKTYFAATQKFTAAETEYLYGLGNVDSVVGIRGQAVNIAQTNTEKRSPMFYSNQGYGILFDMTSNGTLSWQNSNETYAYRAEAVDSIDYYFFYGPEADEVISGYRQVTGTATMLPKNNFGYVQSRNRYATQKQLLDDMKDFRRRQIPVDVTVVDYFWWAPGFNNITKWDPAWTNPAAMMDELHDMHITASISVWPCFQSGSPTYNLVSKKPGFLLPGDSQFGFVYDPTTKDNRDYYWSLINDNVFSKGFDSIWLDACEPEMGTFAKQSGVATAVGNSRPIGLLFPLLTNDGVYNGQRDIKENTKRVNTLTRGAVAGVQRYGTQSWSGDVASTWAQLEKEVRGALNYSAAGLPYFSTDTGGYFGIDTTKEENREMFLRWLQFSTFSGIMRVHGEACIKNPWSFGAEYEEYIVSYINLRERLVPYIYSLAGRVTQDDYSIMRPLVFDWRTDPNVWKIDDQYMFGDYFMVCPVDKLGVRSRDVYLPAGQWIDFWTGKTIQSRGETMNVPATLDQVPVFVKAGAVVPMAMESQYVDEKPDEGEIRVYMGADGKFTLYEDEGNNYNYENGKFSEIPMTYDEASKTLTIGKRTGSFDGMPEKRQFHVVFVQEDYGNGVPSSVRYDKTVEYTGEPVSVTYNPDFEIPVPPLKLSTLPKPGSAPKPQVPARAMVGEWLFSEGEGGKVRDTSGNYNNGAIKNIGTADWTSGMADNALIFSGGSADKPGTYVDVADTDTLDITDGITFSGWVNFTGNSHGNILNKGGNGSNNPGISFIIVNGQKLQIEVQTNDNAKTTIAASSNFPKNAWHHVAFSWQSKAAGGDDTMRIYVDGTVVGSGKFTGKIGTNDYPLRFGCAADNEPAWPNYFKGTMDELRLYNYKLTDADIKALANRKTVGVPNPENIRITPTDGALELAWTDPAVDGLDHVTVAVQSEDGSYKKSFDVKAGEQKLTVNELKNGTYYHVALQSVVGKETSQGAYLVAGVADHVAQITDVVTHDQTVYGYIVNYTNEELSGTLTAQVREMTADGKVVTVTQEREFKVGALDAQRIQLDTGAYADGQIVQLTYRANGKDLAQPVSVVRELQYVPGADADTLREQIKVLVNTPVVDALYTPASVEAYRAVVNEAKAALDNANATVAQLTALKQQLTTTLQLLPDEDPDKAEKEALREELSKLAAQEIDETKYTDESVAAYRALVDEATAALADDTATVTQLQALIARFDTTLVERQEEPKPDILWGDADKSGDVTTNDARLILQYCAELKTAEDLDMVAANVSGDDEEVTTADARLILQYCAELIDSFPAEDNM